MEVLYKSVLDEITQFSEFTFEGTFVIPQSHEPARRSSWEYDYAGALNLDFQLQNCQNYSRCL